MITSISRLILRWFPVRFLWTCDVGFVSCDSHDQRHANNINIDNVRVKYEHNRKFCGFQNKDFVFGFIYNGTTNYGKQMASHKIWKLFEKYIADTISYFCCIFSYSFILTSHTFTGYFLNKIFKIFQLSTNWQFLLLLFLLPLYMSFSSYFNFSMTLFKRVWTHDMYNPVSHYSLSLSFKKYIIHECTVIYLIQFYFKHV